MESFDLSKEYGLVLEGGGAKGAYQIGVWKALKEYGVKIKGVSGVSVGALNGALICMDDLKAAQDIWENISYSKVMNVNNEEMEKLIDGKFSEIDLAELTKQSTKVLTDRGLDVAPLKKWIEELVDEDKIRESPMEFMLGTFSLSRFKELEINAKEVEPGLLKDFLLASSYFPAFKKEKLHGEKFVDGGILNNVPVDMLIKRGYKEIIVVRIYGMGMEKRVKVPEDVHIIEIAPRVNLGSMMEFGSRKSRRNLKIGYFDGIRCIRNLDGKIYYIAETRDEAEYFNRLLHIPEEMAAECADYSKSDYQELESRYRFLAEEFYPLAARELKLDRGWSYKELYLSFLELSAKIMHVPKYNVYMERELKEQVILRYEEWERTPEAAPKLAQLAIKIVISA